MGEILGINRGFGPPFAGTRDSRHRLIGENRGGPGALLLPWGRFLIWAIFLASLTQFDGINPNRSAILAL